MSRQSAARTPETTTSRWLSAGCSCARCVDSRAPAFGSGGAKDHGADTGVHHRAHAHHAGLHRDVQRGASQPVIAHGRGRGPQCDDLGMRSGIVRGDGLIVPGADDLLIQHDDRADGDFADRSRARGFCERKTHERVVQRHLPDTGKRSKVTGQR